MNKDLKLADASVITNNCDEYHSDYKCDECSNGFNLIIADNKSEWPSFKVKTKEGRTRITTYICPKLTMEALKLNHRIVCPKCGTGVLTITATSRFNPYSLLKVLS